MKKQVIFQESNDEFEQAREELLTYTYSQQMPSSPKHAQKQKKKYKNSEKQRLQLMSSQRSQKTDIDLRQLNLNSKKIQCHIGKIIPIGSVIFKSNFQCGNIGGVQQIGVNMYKITLDNQSNSTRISQWFYFSVEGVKGQAHFIIQGFNKGSSLYNQGMKICIKDIKEVSKWRRGGTRIVYSNVMDGDEQTKTYQLRFSHFFKSNEHTCIQFAYSFPYGIKKLNSLIAHIKQHITYESLGKSFDKRDIPLLTIGNRNSQKVIVVSARVHPGQTVSSFIIEGFLKELVGDNQYGRLLRANFLFKVVPMLNPDGVARGNYRFSAAGFDLNRKWKNCKQNTHPQIFFIKEMIRRMNKEKEVIMYIDIHGHSRQKNVFFYGCCQKSGGIVNPKSKEFPFLMSKLYDHFKYQKCSFAIQKDKDGTARITMWKELRIDYVYTLECSFCGPQYGPNYLQNDYQKIGKKLCEGIAVFFYELEQIPKNIPNVQLKQIEKLNFMKKQAFQQLIENPLLLNMGDEEDIGSDSQPEKGQVTQKQRNPETGLPKPGVINTLKAGNRSVKPNTLSENVVTRSLPKYSSKYKSQISTNQQIRSLLMEKKFERGREMHLPLETSKYDQVEIKIANNINTFELQALRASSLYQKNVRVHSLTRNNERNARKVSNPFEQEEGGEERQLDKMKVNLMHVREGVQYRRVRKIAEQKMRRDPSQGSEGMVRGLQSNNIANIELQKNRTIAPRFYPVSQQRNRRTSAEMYFKRHNMKHTDSDLKRLSINGDEVNVKCQGKQIYF